MCTLTRSFNTSQIEVVEMERVCFVAFCKVFLWNHCRNQSAAECLAKHVIFVVDTRAFWYHKDYGYDAFVVILCTFFQQSLFDWEEAFTPKL